MFNNLIESGSHGRDLKRKGSFFIGTFLFYTVLLTAAGVGSIYAYNVRLDEQNDYELTLIRFPAATEKAEPQKPRAQPKSAATNSGGGRQQEVARIRDLVLDTPLPNRPVAPEGARVLARGTVYKIVEQGEYFPPPGNIGGPGDGISRGLPGDRDLPRVTEEVEAPEVKVVKPTPEPPRRPEGPVRVSSSVIAGKAISKPAPPYPPIAKQARQAGVVAVQIVVDEQGRVVSAKASSGPPLLLLAAERAAYQARFTPTLLSGQPVKISGVITYNFILQ